MKTTMIHALIGKKITTMKVGVGALLSVAAMAAAPTSALADRHGDWGHDRDRGSIGIGLDLPGVIVVDQPPVCETRDTQVWVEPVYRTVCDRVWVPVTYKTVCDRTWVEPVVRTECQRVYVPDRYEWRDVVSYDFGYRRIYREQVLVEPAHYEQRDRQVMVTPGHFEDVQRQVLVCDGHWANVDRQELVCAGHWEARETVAVDRPRYEDRGGLRIDLRIPIH